MLLKQSLSSKLYVWNHVALFHWVVSGRISPSPTNHKSVISNPMSRGYHLITVNQSQVSLIQSLCPLYSLIKGVKWFDLKRLRCDLWDYWNEFNRSLKSVMMRAEIHLPIWNLTNLLLVRTSVDQNMTWQSVSGHWLTFFCPKIELFWLIMLTIRAICRWSSYFNFKNFG